MKKISFVISIIILFCCVLTISVFAYSERHEWGSQTIISEAKYATWVNGKGNTETNRKLEYDNVGYTYLNAACTYSGASFTTSIQKRVFIGTWSNQVTANGVINATVEYGYGGNYGSGTYRFLLTPQNNVYPDGQGIGVSPINIQNFSSNSHN